MFCPLPAVGHPGGSRARREKERKPEVRDRLLHLLHARASMRADRRRTLRTAIHLVLIGLAALAALFTAGLVSSPEAGQVSAIRPAPGPDLQASVAAGEAVLRPGVSHDTVESPLRASLPSPEPVRRHHHTHHTSTDDTVSEAVAVAAGAVKEAGYEVRALTERIDPQVPTVLYTVRQGDTLRAIAETYGTTVENILRNNVEADEGGFVPPGQQILVPFDAGILYKVGQGETLADIIGDYVDVTIEDVLAYRPNNLSDPGDIRPGDYILLPNASLKPPPVYSEGGAILGYYGVPEPSPGLFGLPLPVWGFVSDEFGTYRGPGIIHTGIDLALADYPASSVYASCDGWVSRTEWLTYSYGYYVIVDCGDGWDTLYSHFREILVSWGETVVQGETILGISGSTGFSTGEHLHFEIRYNGVPLDPRKYLDFD